MAAGGEREVVVVADDDVVGVHHVHVLDGEEREGQHAVVQRLARQLVRIPECSSGRYSAVFDRFADVSVREGDFIHPLELGHLAEAVVGRRTGGAGFVRRAFAVVALDHQPVGGVDHVEVADGVLVVFQRVLPAAAGPGLPFDVKLQHPQVAFAADVLELLTVPQRPSSSGYSLLPSGRGGYAFKALGARHLEVLLAVRRARQGQRRVVRRFHHLAVYLGVEYRQHFAVARCA